MTRPDPTTVFDAVETANAAYVERFESGALPAPPRTGLAVLTCMDARILPLELFGLHTGDAHVLRNAGGRVTDDVLRSLLVSGHALGTRAIAVVHHTECGMAKATGDELRQVVESATGGDASGIDFHAIADPEADLRADVTRLRDCGLLPDGAEVRGYIYDVHTGRLRHVV